MPVRSKSGETLFSLHITGFVMLGVSHCGESRWALGYSPQSLNANLLLLSTPTNTITKHDCLGDKAIFMVI